MQFLECSQLVASLEFGTLVTSEVSLVYAAGGILAGSVSISTDSCTLQFGHECENGIEGVVVFSLLVEQALRGLVEPVWVYGVLQVEGNVGNGT